MPFRETVLRREPLWEGSPILWDVLKTPLNVLGPGEVFVFGADAQGFHGAGTAGMACRGTAANTWRQDSWFQSARNTPPGDSSRIGNWAVLGQARGYQEGQNGCSYGIVTIVRPGAHGSVSLREIYRQLAEMVLFARNHPERTFLVTALGEGYSGHTREEMALVWKTLYERNGIPENLRFIRLLQESNRYFT